MLRVDDKFDLDEVLDYFNELFKRKKDIKPWEN